MHRLSISRLVAALLAAFAVSGGAANTGQQCAAAAPSGAVRLTLEPRADNALIVDATVDLAEAASIYLEYRSPEVGWLRTLTASAAGSHKLPLLRLRPLTTYEIRAFTLSPEGCPSQTSRVEMTTGSLPATFPQIDSQAAGTPSFQLSLMDLRNSLPAGGQDIRWFVALDQDSQPVWYYQIPLQILRPAAGRGVNGLVRLSSGNLLYNARNYGLEEISPDGRVVRRVRVHRSIHHDLLQLPDGRVLFLGAEERVVDDSPFGGDSDTRVLGDTLYVADLDADREAKVWSAFDTHDPRQRNPLWDDRTEGAKDWTHANSISLGPRGNVLVSLKNINQVISLAPDFATVEWRLGGPGSSFDFPDPSDRFYGQHTPIDLPGDRILLFDNGNFRPDVEYSRGLELQLDFVSMTARKVWQYRHVPDVFSGRLSNIVRLPNDNRLLNFGFQEGPKEPLLMVEARPGGGIAWQLAQQGTERRLLRHHVYPLDSLAGETSVQPTSVNLPTPRGTFPPLGRLQLDQVISLSPDLKTIELKLGGRNSGFSFADRG